MNASEASHRNPDEGDGLNSGLALTVEDSSERLDLLLAGDRNTREKIVADQSFANYEEFFTFYLREHSHPGNRLMHAAGTLLGLCTVIVPFVIGHPWYALLWPVVAYGFAWTGHFLIEGNKPATFGHPFWSFISDFRMLGLMLTGKLSRHAGVSEVKPSRSPQAKS